MKITAQWITDNVIGVDTCSKRDGVFTARKGFFYTHGGTAEKFAERIECLNVIDEDREAYEEMVEELRDWAEDETITLDEFNNTFMYTLYNWGDYAGCWIKVDLTF